MRSRRKALLLEGARAARVRARVRGRATYLGFARRERHGSRRRPPRPGRRSTCVQGDVRAVDARARVDAADRTSSPRTRVLPRRHTSRPLRAHTGVVVRRSDGDARVLSPDASRVSTSGSGAADRDRRARTSPSHCPDRDDRRPVPRDGARRRVERDNGAPGIRAQYDANYYAAYVLDPDGNNIEGVCHRAPT